MKPVKVAVLILTLSSSLAAQYPADRLDPFLGTFWYGIYMQDKKIGYASIGLYRNGNNQWEYGTDLHMTFEMNQTPVPITSTDRRTYAGENVALVANAYENKSSAASIDVTGARVGDKYEITMDIMGQKSSKELDFPVENLNDIMEIQIKASSGKLKPGDSFVQTVFVPEPAILDTMTHIIKFTEQKSIYFSGVNTEVYTFRDSIPSLQVAGNVYLEKSGNIIMQDFPAMGLVMKLEPEDMAKKQAAGFDILKDNVIKVESGPDNPKEVKSGDYIVSGIKVEQLPQSSWAKIDVISPDSANVQITQKIFSDSGLGLPVTDTAFAPYLGAEPLIQSDNEEIKSLALEIKGNESNAFESAKKINQWVHDNISKEFSPDISNAYQTLKTGKGDCGEHAALAVALMRAAGIPSRIAAGVAYAPSAGGFGYHAWVEAYIGQWIQMDPTWGETYADATHIMLVHGNLKDQIIAVFNALRGLRIQIVSFD